MTKLVDMVFILTDRKTLDKNIKDEVENFIHLKDVVGLARKAEDLPRVLKGAKADHRHHPAEVRVGIGGD